MATKIYDHLTIDGDDAKLDGAVIANLENNEEFSELKSGVNELYATAYVTDSASGGVAHFEDGADNVPLKSLKVNIEPVQSGSGDPSPDNVRPITGWESVKVTRAGKNLLPKYVINPPLYNGVTFTVNSDGSVRANGTATATCNASSADITGIGGEVTLSGCPSDGSSTTYQLWFYDKTANASTAIIDTGNGSTGTLIKDHVYVVRIRIQSGYTVDKTFYPMIRLASDADDTYEPYNGNTYDISLASAGTVYGGTLDVVSGELTVDYGSFLLNDATISRVTYSSYNVFRVNPPSATVGSATDGWCEAFKTDTISADKNNIITFANSYWSSANRRIVIKADEIETVEAFKTQFGQYRVIYRLATPQTIQLTPQQVTSLLGVNNVWSDAGDVEVEYRADTKLYINKRLAEVTA